jgi:hypothetical protein
MSHRSLRFYNVRQPEQLETRAMLAGNGFMPFAFGGHLFGDGPGPQAMPQFVSSAIAGQSAGHERGFASFGSHAANDETSFTATLTDSSGTATGTATYSTQTVEGEVQTTFSVTVAGAAADTTFDVAVGDTVVGQLTTDETGAGSLVLSSNPTGTEQQLPADFPTAIGADTAITVGTLSGTLAADTDSSDGESGGHGGCHHSSVDTSLSASLTDSDTTSTATGTATYQVDSESGDTTFSVSVTGATVSSTLDVAIDDIVVGQLTTDETGAGSLALSSNPTSPQQQLPADFPTNLSAGSTVTVGTLTGTLASTSTGTDVATHIFGRRR